jgi:Kef-type K+ transport system membrane component KefB
MGGGGKETLLDGRWAVTPFSLFLVQIVVIVSFTRLLAAAFKRVYQPTVVADIVAGIVLGPSVMGRVTGFSDGLFPAQALVTLGVMSNIGLISFMFVVGMELNLKLLRADLHFTALIALFGLFVPCVAAGGITYWLNGPEYVTASVHGAVLTLFFTVILGISALPVLARILSERGMLATRLGSVSMSVATCDDVIAWVLLAIVLALLSPGSKLRLLWTVLLVIGEGFCVWLAVKPAFAMLATRGDSTASASVASNRASPDTIIWALLLLFTVAYLAEMTGISSLIGAFQAGLVVPRDRPLRRQLVEALEPSVCALFVPLYFAYSGLRTNFGLIDSVEAAGVAVALIVIATLAKVIGILIPALWLKIPVRLSCVLGVLMSCKVSNPIPPLTRGIILLSLCSVAPPLVLSTDQHSIAPGRLDNATGTRRSNCRKLRY